MFTNTSLHHPKLSLPFVRERREGQRDGNERKKKRGRKREKKQKGRKIRSQGKEKERGGEKG